MKTKFNEFVKKIKNWLSSLSKWAQKNKLKLFALLFSTFLLFGSFITCSNNKKTASASVLTSDKAFVVTPSFSANLNISSSFYTASIMPFYITYRQTSNTYSVSVPRAATSYTGLVYRDIYLTRDSDDFNYLYSNNQSIVCNSYESASNTSKFNDLFVDISIRQYTNNYDYIVSNGSYCNVVTNYTNSNIIYQYFDSNDNALLVLTISGIPFYSAQDNTSIRYSSFNVIFGASIDDINQIAVSNAYNDGYNVGYNYGYNIGFQNGFSAGDIDNTPMGILATNINAILDIDLFGNFSLSDLISLYFGCILLGFVIKIFLGG